MSEPDVVRTGIAGLDEILSGGIPRGNVILLEGAIGCGKTTLGLEFVYHGASQFGEPGIIVLFEVSPNKIVRDALGFGWDLGALEQAGRLRIVFTSRDVLRQELQQADQVALAFETAGQALEADACDPAAHWAMGRALWLRREHDGAISALEQSIRLSPSFALAHYGLAFVHCQTGDPERALVAADTADHLSPLDPMLFAIHGARTFALLRLGRVDEAAEFALRGGQQPYAHVHAHGIAALTLAIAGRIEESHAERRRIISFRPDYNFRQFKDTFHMLDDLADIYGRAAKLVEIPE
jgi:tetratricopeptide (TPR) repeat protein